MSDKKTDYTFEFTPAYQEAIVGYCLVDAKFFHRCMSKLKAEWFTCSPTTVMVYTQMIAFYNKHGYAPKCVPVGGVSLPEEMLNEPWFLQQTIQDREKIRVEIVKCIASRESVSLETLQKNMTGWLRKKMLMETLTISASKLNKNGYEDSYEWTSRRVKEIWDASFFDEFKVESFEGAVEFFQATDLSNRSISTGCTYLDRAMGGGLFKGETCAIMAPTNAGKSRALMTMTRHAVVQGQKVLFISHEDNASKIKERILSSVIGLPPRLIRMAINMNPVNMAGRPDANGNFPTMPHDTLLKLNVYVLNQIKMAEELLQKNLVYLPYIRTGKMFAEDLIDEIQKLQESEILKTGRGFDMIVDDYPKKLKLKNRGGKDSLYRAELAEIYDMFNQLAIELDVHSLVAIQTNRTGAQMNKGKVENDRFLGNEEIDESYGIAQNMGCVVTLNRSDDDKSLDILHYNVSKSRNEKNDISVTTRADYGSNLLHGDWTCFQKYGTIKLTHPLASEGNESNKKIPALEADRLLKETEAQIQMQINGFLELNKELVCNLPILGK